MTNSLPPNKNAKDKSAFRLPIQKNSQILAIFAIVCTVIVGLVNELTKDRIQEQTQLQLLNTLHEIIEPSSYNNEITQDCVNISSPLLGSTQNTNIVQKAYIARNNNSPVAVAITSTALDGYNGKIELIVAINIDNSISGVRVLKHQETPGLGDKVELKKSNWITAFNGKKLLSELDTRWQVTKDGGTFDQFTGATITPRAIVKAVKNTLLFFIENKNKVLTLPNSCLIGDQEPQPEYEATNEY
ncbi:electron transport complex subunit RsxG [Colwellia sp. 4_MG-2023]|jgi:electron transport complex protein RnfG|uniref:electron transport complex subunit RsxG n=1 Tax=unclassified Colwellia TaxID=196834 RepID=UPI0026E2695D|nr:MULTISPECIES: electron transport complex subunit RsxG [unclassified Colwellia]MDO6487649.1 electron transport complex subunit RsxG [Colwellia sp. 6_MG-2023]MDO6507379.1 electron transport complex subunit RsxG [Colwellia sp. 5_MG-2023]MDO6556112.1 electron transport complex subunit RsxG [Colwellia sp. 4_MG-2023]